MFKSRPKEEKKAMDPKDFQNEFDDYLSDPEAEKNEKALADALNEKAILLKNKHKVPDTLENTIKELQLKNPLNKIPKWATSEKWIKALETRKTNLEKFVAELKALKMHPDTQKQYEDEIERIKEKLETPESELLNISRKEYATKIRNALELGSGKEFDADHKKDLIKTRSAALEAKLNAIEQEISLNTIVFTPNVQKYFDDNMKKFRDQISKGVLPAKKETDSFKKNIKIWKKMPEDLRNKFTFIEGEQAKSYKLLLKSKLNESYEEMADTLEKNGYDKTTFPKKEDVLKGILALGPEVLKSISKFKKPTLLITPAENFKTRVDKLDAKYSQTTDKTIYDEPVDDKLWGPKSTANFTVSIVDGAPDMAVLTDPDPDSINEEKYKSLEKKYRKSKMKHISTAEYAMLALKSLRDFTMTTDPDALIDTTQMTLLNRDHLSGKDSEKIPYAYFTAEKRFAFKKDYSNGKDKKLCGRPSVEVMKI